MGQQMIVEGAPVQTRAPIPIDILFPVHGRPELTVKNIKAIFSYTTTPFHLIVLDDTDAAIEQGSFHGVDSADVTSPFFEKLVKKYSNVTYINSPKPYREGNEFFNVGFRYCKHDYIAAIMNSVTVQHGWELHGLELFETQPDLGIVGLKNLFPTGTIESAGIIFNNFTPCDFGRDAPGYSLTDDIQVPAAQWAFVLLRKKAVIGNIEEGIFHGFVGWDDIDNCMAVRSKGWKVIYCGHGVGIHEPRATRGDSSLEASLKNKENAITFYKRWGFWEKYQEANKLDVSYKLKPESKEKLTAVVLELQVLQTLMQERQAKLKVLGSEVMRELGVLPDKFNLEMNPQQNLWSLTPITEKLTAGTEHKPVSIGAERDNGDKEIAELQATMGEEKSITVGKQMKKRIRKR